MSNFIQGNDAFHQATCSCKVHRFFWLSDPTETAITYCIYVAHSQAFKAQSVRPLVVTYCAFISTSMWQIAQNRRILHELH